MNDKRAEMLAWAKSLNPGDKVILSYGFREFSVLEVKGVTPTGWVKTTNGMTFSQNSYSDLLHARGKGYGTISPITEELLQKAKKQDEKRAEEKRKRDTIISAKNVIYRQYKDSHNITYPKAVRILKAFESLEEEDK